MTHIGIDYSMTSPALCVYTGTPDWDPSSCMFYFFKKKMAPWKQFIPSEYPLWSTDQERYQKLTAWVMSAVNKHDVTSATIENYALGAGGSQGRVFHIAENTGLMKYALWLNKTPFDVVSPTTVKKYATGKGNAKKIDMMRVFEDDVGVKLHEVLNCKEGVETPASDIADAYWICKWGFEMNLKKD